MSQKIILLDRPTLAGVPLVAAGETGMFYTLPPLAGGDGASPVAYPLGPPAISGNQITVDGALNNPSRITRDIADLTMQKYFADRVFSPAGGMEGGALLFERPNAVETDLFATREPKEVAPGDEFPLTGFLRGVPMVARPRKIGSKWFMTREARLRNNTGLLTRYMRQTANTIRRRTEQMAVAELSAVVTAETRYGNGTSWATFAGTAVQSRTGTTGPVADILSVQKTIDLEERGHTLNGAIMHPNQAMSIRQAYPNTPIGTVLADAGITEYSVTPRYTGGRVLLYESGQVGEWRNEFPLEEEVWQDKDGRQRTWYQWSISPSMVVVDQFAMYELRAVA